MRAAPSAAAEKGAFAEASAVAQIPTDPTAAPGEAGTGGAARSGGATPERVVVPYAPGEERFGPSGATFVPAAEESDARLPRGITARQEETPAPPIAAPEEPERPAEPAAPPTRSGDAIKIFLGLLFLFALAYLAGHRVVREWERRLGLAEVVTAGFPFVALGLIARLPEVGILTDPVLVDLSPLLHLALGWIGFAIGFRFDLRLLDSLPEGTAPKVAFSTGVPFLAIMAAAGAVLLGDAGWSQSLRDPAFLRDAVVLASAGAITARTAARVVARHASHQPLVLQIIQLEELAGIAGLTVVGAYFRPVDEATWQLPGTAWIFITFGLGAAMGLLAYAILRRRATSAEALVLLLGTVAFAAGFASNLLLSPIVVCFVAGALLVNFPGAYKERVGAALARLERPIYFLFLVIVGAIWTIDDWRGWVLMAVFLVARFVGGWLGVRLGWSQGEITLTRDEQIVLAAAPMGQLSIAIVISALLLYPQGSVPLLVTAVLGGALVTEVVVKMLARELHRQRKEARP